MLCSGAMDKGDPGDRKRLITGVLGGVLALTVVLLVFMWCWKEGEFVNWRVVIMLM